MGRLVPLVLRSWALPLIVLALIAPAVAAFALTGPQLGLAVGALTVGVVIVLASRAQFDEAIENYTKAWETHKDIAYMTNLGAAKFEKGDYQGCIEACQQAIEYGREIYADFKIIAK